MSARLFFFGGFGLGHLPLRPLYTLLENNGHRIIPLPFPEDGIRPEEAVTRLVRQAGICRDDLVAGWSLGGQLAALAAQYSGSRLITITSNPHFCASPQYPFGMPVGEFAAFCRRQQCNPRGNLKHFARLIARNGNTTEVTELLDNLSAALPPDTPAWRQAQLFHLNWLAALDTFPVLHRLPAAQLHIFGSLDVLFDAAALIPFLPRHDAARNVVIDGAGHLMPLTHSETVFTLIRNFLAAGQTT